MVFCFICYFLTYAFELRHAVLKPPKLVLNVDEEKMPHDIIHPSPSSLDERICIETMNSTASLKQSSPRSSFLHFEVDAATAMKMSNKSKMYKRHNSVDFSFDLNNMS